MSAPTYTGKGGYVWKESVETRHPDGTISFTLGFRVCKMMPEVGDGVEVTLALMLNLAERAEADAAIRADLLAALQEIANKSIDATDPELTSETSWGNNDDVFGDGKEQARFELAVIARAAILKATGQEAP